MLGLLTMTGTLQSPTFADSGYNQRVPTFPGTSTTIACLVQGLTPEEQRGTGVTDKVISTHKGFAESGSGVAEHKRLVVSGVTYEIGPVNGDPGGQGHHMEFQLKQMETVA